MIHAQSACINSAADAVPLRMGLHRLAFSILWHPLRVRGDLSMPFSIFARSSAWSQAASMFVQHSSGNWTALCRWTMTMKFKLGFAIYRPELVFTGQSFYGVDANIGIVRSQLDVWDATQNNQYPSVSVTEPVAKHICIRSTLTANGRMCWRLLSLPCLSYCNLTTHFNCQPMCSFFYWNSSFAWCICKLAHAEQMYRSLVLMLSTDAVN